MLSLQNNWTSAWDTYASLDAATAGWDQIRKDQLSFGVSRVFTDYNVGRLDEGIAAANRLVDLKTKMFGPQHAETALAQGALAVGLFRAGRHDDALRLFRLAAPILLTRGAQGDDDDAVAAAAREERIQIVIETYLSLLARRGSAASAESFGLADAIRGHSVQQALAASSARARMQGSCAGRTGRARNRTCKSRSTPNSARSTTCWRALRPGATTTASKALQSRHRQSARRTHEKVRATSPSISRATPT